MPGSNARVATRNSDTRTFAFLHQDIIIIACRVYIEISFVRNTHKLNIIK